VSVLSGLLIVGVLAGMLVLGRVLLRPQQRSGPGDQVSQFESAREVTNRWAQDPNDMPGPLREFNRRASRPSEPEDAPVETRGGAIPDQR